MEQMLTEADINYLELTAKHSPKDLGTEENARKVLMLLSELNVLPSYQDSIEHLESEVELLKDELMDVQSERDEMRDELETKESEISDLEDKVDDLQSETEALREEIDALN